MKRKVLQDHANVFCQMFVGWRMVANDVPALLRLGRGTLAVDVLTGETRFAGAPIRPLYVAGEFQAWFARQLAEHGIPREVIESATLEADFEAGTAPARRGERHTLAIRCRSAIRTAERTYNAELAEDVHIVHVRAI